MRRGGKHPASPPDSQPEPKRAPPSRVYTHQQAKVSTSAGLSRDSDFASSAGSSRAAPPISSVLKPNEPADLGDMKRSAGRGGRGGASGSRRG